MKSLKSLVLKMAKHFIFLFLYQGVTFGNEISTLIQEKCKINRYTHLHANNK